MPVRIDNPCNDPIRCKFSYPYGARFLILAGVILPKPL
jgi:hypothetical protein